MKKYLQIFDAPHNEDDRYLNPHQSVDKSRQGYRKMGMGKTERGECPGAVRGTMSILIGRPQDGEEGGGAIGEIVPPTAGPTIGEIVGINWNQWNLKRSDLWLFYQMRT